MSEAVFASLPENRNIISPQLACYFSPSMIAVPSLSFISPAQSVARSLAPMTAAVCSGMQVYTSSSGACPASRGATVLYLFAPDE